MPPRFSTTVRSSSKPFAVVAAVTVALSPPANFLLAPSMAALASDPPVPFKADTAKPAVSQTISCNVALPLRACESVSDTGTVGCHRGSNQSELKSSREKQSMVRRIEQYTQGLCNAKLPSM